MILSAKINTDLENVFPSSLAFKIKLLFKQKYSSETGGDTRWREASSVAQEKLFPRYANEIQLSLSKINCCIKVISSRYRIWIQYNKRSV